MDGQPTDRMQLKDTLVVHVVHPMVSDGSTEAKTKPGGVGRMLCPTTCDFRNLSHVSAGVSLALAIFFSLHIGHISVHDISVVKTKSINVTLL